MNYKHYCKGGILVYDISHHLPTYATNIKSKPIKHQYRDYTHFDSTAFHEELDKKLKENYAQISIKAKKYTYNDFVTIFKNILDEDAP